MWFVVDFLFQGSGSCVLYPVGAAEFREDFRGESAMDGRFRFAAQERIKPAPEIFAELGLVAAKLRPADRGWFSFGSFSFAKKKRDSPAGETVLSLPAGQTEDHIKENLEA